MGNGDEGRATQKKNSNVRKERAKRWWKRGYTPSWIAREIGVHRSTIYDYIKEFRNEESDSQSAVR